MHGWHSVQCGLERRAKNALQKQTGSQRQANNYDKSLCAHPLHCCYPRHMLGPCPYAKRRNPPNLGLLPKPFGVELVQAQQGAHQPQEAGIVIRDAMRPDWHGDRHLLKGLIHAPCRRPRTQVLQRRFHCSAGLQRAHRWLNWGLRATRWHLLCSSQRPTDLPSNLLGHHPAKVLAVCRWLSSLLRHLPSGHVQQVPEQGPQTAY